MKSNASLIAVLAVVVIGAAAALTLPILSGPPAAPAPQTSPPAPVEAGGASVPIPVPDMTTLELGTNACTNPYTGKLVSTWDGICEANHKIYQCYCPNTGGCDFDRTPGRERGDCTTPGAVHPVMAP